MLALIKENLTAQLITFIWGVPAMTCIIGVRSLHLSIRTGFLQIRKFPYGNES